MVKNYILDTNVLIHDPKSIYSFEDNNVILPLPVLEEIDGLKKRNGEIGRNAREVARELDELRKRGRIYEGVPLDNGGTLRIMVLRDTKVKLPRFLSDKMDNWILLYTLDLMENSDLPTYLITKDINLRIKAETLGIKAQDYLRDRTDPEELFSGYVEIRGKKELAEKLMREGFLDPKEVGLEDLRPNEFVDMDGVYGRYVEKYRTIKKLDIDFRTRWWGIKPRNREQLFAMDLLLDDSVKLVTLIGTAGTGKTLLSITAGLVKVLDERRYRKLVVTKPVVPMGRDIGYIPGKPEEKMLPWIQPIIDNMEFLFSNRNRDFDIDSMIKRGRGKVEILILSYLRGRSIPDQFIIIDEAQNLTPHEVKTIITRVGKNTKIVLTGDPSQIDSPYLDEMSNGLVYVTSKFYEEPLAGHVSLTRGERSELASRAVELLK